jgi:hypothetical protein
MYKNNPPLAFAVRGGGLPNVITLNWYIKRAAPHLHLQREGGGWCLLVIPILIAPPSSCSWWWLGVLLWWWSSGVIYCHCCLLLLLLLLLPFPPAIHPISSFSWGWGRWCVVCHHEWSWWGHGTHLGHHHLFWGAMSGPMWHGALMGLIGCLPGGYPPSGVSQHPSACSWSILTPFTSHLDGEEGVGWPSWGGMCFTSTLIITVVRCSIVPKYWSKIISGWELTKNEAKKQLPMAQMTFIVVWAHIVSSQLVSRW